MQHFNRFEQPIGHPISHWKVPPCPSRIALAGKYCSVQPLVAKLHAGDLYEADAEDRDGTSWTYLPYGPFPSLMAYEDWISATCQGDDPMFFAIIDFSFGKPVGVASYLRIIPESGSIEVGHVHYSPRLQRSRAATEAMYLMMKNAFDLGYRRYEWKCDSLNAPSCAAANRLGFFFEGIFRQATTYRGRNRDTAWYSIIDSEWPQLEGAFTEWLSDSNFDQDGNQRVALSKLTLAGLKRAAR